MTRLLFFLTCICVATLCAVAQESSTEKIRAANANIAAAMKKGDLKDAAKHAKEAAQMSESHFGPTSRQTAISYENLGIVLAADNKHKLAIEPFKKALEIFRLDEASAKDAVKILGKLATSQLESGQAKEAEATLLEYRTSAETRFGDKSKELLQAKVATACVYSRAREPVKAWDEFIESYAMALKTFGRESSELDHVASACEGVFIEDFWGNSGRVEAARKKLSGLLGYQLGSPTKLAQADYSIEAPMRGPTDVNIHFVVVKAWIDEQGNVKSAKLVFGESRFNDLALSGAKDSRFRPSLKDGKPMADVMYFAFDFIRK